MVVSRTLLFLFGACIASAHVLRNGKPCGYKHAPVAFTETISKPEHLQPYANTMEKIAPGLPPFMSHFVQKGSNLFYKPPITLSPYHMPMPIPMPMPMPVAELTKKDCKKKPEIVVAEPVPPVFLPAFDEVIEVKPMPVPQAPELPSFVMPELPTIVVEEPMPNHGPIPQAPELPPFVMPEMPTVVYDERPVFVAEAPEIALPVPVQEIEVIDHRPIPQAPALPPFVMPEMPTVVYGERPEFFPEAPEIALPVPVQEIEVIDHRPIPQAPALPPFVMPEMPIILHDEPPKAPCHHEHPVHISDVPQIALPVPVQEIEVFDHRPIPQAPELPPFVMPEMPTVVYDKRPEFFPEAPEIALPVPLEEIVVIDHRPIPQAPELPPFVMPEMPIILHEEPPKAPCHHEHPVRIPEAPEIALPASVQEIEFIDHRPIPHAPELPPFVMPELPVVVYEEPALPSIISKPMRPSPAIISQSPIVEVYEYEPLMIAQAPELPPLHLPELSEFVEQNAPEIRPVKIPAAPELPAIVMPTFSEPIVVETVYAEEPCDDDKPAGVIGMVPFPVVLPQPMDEACDEDDKPAVVIETVPAPQPAHLPLSFPTLYAENIIIERLLPNMIYNGQMYEKSLYPVGSKYPAPYFAPALY